MTPTKCPGAIESAQHHVKEGTGLWLPTDLSAAGSASAQMWARAPQGKYLEIKPLKLRWMWNFCQSRNFPIFTQWRLAVHCVDAPAWGIGWAAALAYKVATPLLTTPASSLSSSFAQHQVLLSRKGWGRASMRPCLASPFSLSSVSPLLYIPRFTCLCFLSSMLWQWCSMLMRQYVVQPQAVIFQVISRVLNTRLLLFHLPSRSGFLLQRERPHGHTWAACHCQQCWLTRRSGEAKFWAPCAAGFIPWLPAVLQVCTHLLQGMGTSLQSAEHRARYSVSQLGNERHLLLRHASFSSQSCLPSSWLVLLH